MKKIFLLGFMVVGIGVFAAHHEEEKVAAQGMISSDVFDLAGQMHLYVEKYESCGPADGKDHYHPYVALAHACDAQYTTTSPASFDPVKNDASCSESPIP